MDTLRRLGRWWIKYAGTLAILFASLTVALLVVVCSQAAMLYSLGSRLVMGNLAEWVAAGGTAIAAVGVLAAFGNLRIVRREWESAQGERRDQRANQARLIIVEAVPRAEQVPPANEAPRRPDMQPEYRYVLIRNHSNEPVFNVRILHESPKQTTPPAPVTVFEVVSQEDASGSFRSATPTIVHRAHPRLIPVLAPGKTTYQLHLQQCRAPTK